MNRAGVAGGFGLAVCAASGWRENGARVLGGDLFGDLFIGGHQILFS
jgi:hypothetical protein